MNSPFDQEEFRLHMAEAWVRRGKADIIDGVLIFKDEFSLSIQRQFQREELDKRTTEAHDAMIDLERSPDGRTGSIGVWKAVNSGPQSEICRKYGGPQNRVKQMQHVFRRVRKPEAEKNLREAENEIKQTA